METNQTRSELVSRYRHLSVLLRDESLSDSDARAICRERDLVQAKISAIDSGK